MRLKTARLTLASGEKTLYACMFVFTDKGEPVLYENWGPEGYPMDRFIEHTREKFARFLVMDGINTGQKYEEYWPCYEGKVIRPWEDEKSTDRRNE